MSFCRSLLLLTVLPRTLSFAPQTLRRHTTSIAMGKQHADERESAVNIHWFRQTDLRLHDNPALCRTVDLSLGRSKKPVGASVTESTPLGILPVFVFDTSRIYGSNTRSELGSLKCSARRAQFVLQAVSDLRSNLEKRGSGLIVGVGKPEDVIAELAKGALTHSSNGAKLNIVCQEEVCSEELATEKAMRSQLARAMNKGSKFVFETVWGGTMYDPATLPFDGGVNGIPDTFTPFRYVCIALMTSLSAVRPTRSTSPEIKLRRPAKLATLCRSRATKSSPCLRMRTKL